MNCCDIHVALCMLIDACLYCCCVLGFSSFLSSTGIVADVEADAMMLLRLSMIVWVDGFEVEEWTSAIQMRYHLNPFEGIMCTYIYLV